MKNVNILKSSQEDVRCIDSYLMLTVTVLSTKHAYVYIYAQLSVCSCLSSLTSTEKRADELTQGKAILRHRSMESSISMIYLF